ncbi:MAG TPA: flagellar brake protein [Rubrivivax sp.]|nr:flagellar brake protein [Rubrivivax sp.]
MFEHTRPAELDARGAADGRAEFRVGDRAERLALLKQLRDGSVPVSLNAPQGAVLVMQLWSLDAAQQQLSFSAYADCGAMQRLAQGGEAVAVAYLDSVKLQFELAGLVLVRGAHHHALRAQLPELMYRFQRRSGYRVRALERSAPQAELRHPSLPDMRLRLRIVDLSVGGCALLLPGGVPALPPGTLLHGVRIALDDRTAFQATLRLQHLSAMHGAMPVQRLGCEFTELDGAAQRGLQRHIDQTQQRRRRLALR